MNAQPSSVLSRELLPASTAVYLTVALAAFEGLAVGAALPEVAADLGNLELLPWVITAYLLTSGIATIVSGPLVDGLGVRLIFRWAAVVFSVAGFAAAFAPNMQVMVAIRLVQGVGGGLLIAAGLGAVSLLFPEHLVGRAFAANSTVWGVMGLAGPAIAGAMLTFLSWRWIFLINLPLGMLALVVGWRVMPGAVEAAKPKVDATGVAIVSVFTIATVVAVDELGPTSLIWLAVALAAGWLYLRRAGRIDDPVVRLRHISEQPYLGLGLSLGLMLVGAVAANVYVPLYVRAGRGASAAFAAASVLFFVFGWTSGANIGSRFLDRHSETFLMTVGFALTGPGLAIATAGAWADAPLWVVFFGLFFAGSGLGVSTNAGLTLLRALTPPEQIGRATAAHQFFRNQGITFGAALGGAIILFVVAADVGDIEVVRDIITGDSPAVEGAAAAVRRGFATAGSVGLAIVGLGLVATRSLRRHLQPAREAKRGPT